MSVGSRGVLRKNDNTRHCCRLFCSRRYARERIDCDTIMLLYIRRGTFSSTAAAGNCVMLNIRVPRITFTFAVQTIRINLFSGDNCLCKHTRVRATWCTPLGVRFTQMYDMHVVISYAKCTRLRYKVANDVYVYFEIVPIFRSHRIWKPIGP
jgi:hypothetical protein